jgi:hypothetical protein
MTIATEGGYTWADGKNARLLHVGNKLPAKTITPSDEAVAGNGQLVDNGLTRDRWAPFGNQAEDATALDGSAWTAARVTVGADGQTLAETTDNGTHFIQQAYTFSAEETVVAFEVERQTVPEIRLYATDGTSVWSAFFDLRDGTAGTVAGGAVAQIVDLGRNRFLCSITFTPLAAAGSFEIGLSDGTETVSYAGSTDSTIKVRRAVVHASVATLRLDTFGARQATCFAIGAHTLGAAGARVTFQHDSNGDDTWTDIGTATPGDDSALMFFFDAITSDRWRIQVDRGVLPEVGVMWVGDPLVMQRPLYAGMSPARMNRKTDVIGNLSRTGELLGRSIKRTTLSESFNWVRLTYDWVRTNLDGPNGAIQALEADVGFIAWRPEVTQDASFIMRATSTAPAAMGIINLWTFGLKCEVYSYE